MIREPINNINFKGINITHCLRSLGNAVGAFGVSFWKDAGRDRYARRVALWDGRADKGLKFKPDINQTEQAVSDPVFFGELPPNWREAREGVELDRGLVLPVSLNGEAWGFALYRREERNWWIDDAVLGVLTIGNELAASLIEISLERTEMERSLKAAQSASRAKSEFVARVSHELRTPMNAILLMTELAKKTDDIVKMRYFIDTVDTASRQLISIVNNVLDMSKIDANKLEIVNREFNFEDMVKNIVEAVKVKIDEKELIFRLNQPHVIARYVYGDELRLHQTILNLLSNAIKFTGAGGMVTLKARFHSKDENTSRLQIDIIDTGIGIPKNKQELIFQDYQQVESGLSREYGGTGLGLTICRKLVELMGGRIWVESEQDEGSTFSFEVDIGWGRMIEKQMRKKYLRGGFRVLAVDDTKDVLLFFQDALLNFEIDCDIAESGMEAIELVKRSVREDKPYDVILMDWYMPEMNGGQAIREIKNIQGGRSVFVMITSDDESDFKKYMAEEGVNHFLIKPVLSSDLYDVLVKISNLPPHADGPVNTAAKDQSGWVGTRVLLVEDNKINREAVIGILEDTGLIIETAANGLEAVQMYTKAPERFKLILMDIEMPIMDGLSASRQIRGSDAKGCRDIPILAMTANAFAEDKEASFSAGMNGHITKPIDVELLFAELRKHLGHCTETA